jgi:spore coat protein GerQ
LAFFAVSGAHAANIIDNNPLYRPDSGHFYSVTTLESHTKTTNLLTLGEEFGYGLTPDLAVIIGTSMSQSDWFENSQWGSKVFKGRLEAAGKDHIIISDTQTGTRYLLLSIYLDYVTFEEEINYYYPYQQNTPR